MTLPDSAHLEFLAPPGAFLSAEYNSEGRPELRLFGNRAGILGLASGLLWLLANTSEREFLSLSELPFVRPGGPQVVVHVLDTGAASWQGAIRSSGGNYEWLLTDDQLRHAGLAIHELACVPGKEYIRLLLAEDSAVDLQVRIQDVHRWL